MPKITKDNKKAIKRDPTDDDGNKADDCSDLTDNNPEAEESTSKSFPQKVSITRL